MISAHFGWQECGPVGGGLALARFRRHVTR
jgi:hypothetical protein